MLVAANDGVGTKVKIAIELDMHDTIGVDLVAMCVNDLVVQGAEPLFFLDYYATGKLDPEVAAAVVKGIADGCVARAARCSAARRPKCRVFTEGDYDLAGFAVGAAERKPLLPRDVYPGDVVFGLPSSGVHSNGYSLVRRIVKRAGLSWEATAPFAPDMTLAHALLTPTRIYVKPLLAALKATPHIARWRISPAAAFPTICRACCPKDSASRSTSRPSRSASLPLARGDGRGRAKRDAAHLQLRRRHGGLRRGRRRRGRDGPARSRRKARARSARSSKPKQASAS